MIDLDSVHRSFFAHGCRISSSSTLGRHGDLGEASDLPNTRGFIVRIGIMRDLLVNRTQCLRPQQLPAERPLEARPALGCSQPVHARRASAGLRCGLFWHQDFTRSHRRMLTTSAPALLSLALDPRLWAFVRLQCGLRTFQELARALNAKSPTEEASVRVGRQA